VKGVPNRFAYATSKAAVVGTVEPDLLTAHFLSYLFGFVGGHVASLGEFGLS
jgi:hypothetical protein